MPQTATSTYLDPQTLATIESLELRARLIVEGMMVGMHRSPFHGVSIEFAEHRPYVPGDDLRHVDWKVYGRTDKLYVKRYHQETNLDLLVLVDVSGSMGYTSQGSGWRKYDHAASLAAAVAYLALQQQDRVGLTLFDHEERVVVRPSGARDHWRSIVSALSDGFGGGDRRGVAEGESEVEEDRGTDLGQLFSRVAAQAAQRSLVVLVSDLLDDPNQLERGLARLSHRQHDLILLQTLDHAELTFPFRTPSQFLGLEGEGRLNLDPPALREAYLAALERHQRKLEEGARRFGFDHRVLDTSTHLGPPLSHLLARRAVAVSRRS